MILFKELERNIEKKIEELFQTLHSLKWANTMSPLSLA